MWKLAVKWLYTCDDVFVVRVMLVVLVTSCRFLSRKVANVLVVLVTSCRSPARHCRAYWQSTEPQSGRADVETTRWNVS